MTPKYVFLIAPVILAISSLAVPRITDTHRGPAFSSTIMNLQASILTHSGQGAPGFNVGMASQLGTEIPVYIGGEVGMYLETVSPSYAIVPLLGQVYVQFATDATVHPLIGVLAGPVIATGGGDSAAAGLGMLFRPGINIDVGRTAALNLEARFGVIGSSFVIAPTIGAIVAI